MNICTIGHRFRATVFQTFSLDCFTIRLVQSSWWHKVNVKMHSWPRTTFRRQSSDIARCDMWQFTNAEYADMNIAHRFRDGKSKAASRGILASISGSGATRQACAYSGTPQTEGNRSIHPIGTWPRQSMMYIAIHHLALENVAPTSQQVPLGRAILQESKIGVTQRPLRLSKAAASSLSGLSNLLSRKIGPTKAHFIATFYETWACFGGTYRRWYMFRCQRPGMMVTRPLRHTDTCPVKHSNTRYTLDYDACIRVFGRYGIANGTAPLWHCRFTHLSEQVIQTCKLLEQSVSSFRDVTMP
jgi:hypothetical protein